MKEDKKNTFQEEIAKAIEKINEIFNRQKIIKPPSSLGLSEDRAQFYAISGNFNEICDCDIIMAKKEMV